MTLSLVFFLEEPSASEMLRGLLPKLIPSGVFVQYVIFEGKQDLEKQLTRRLRHWQVPNSKFIVLRDQDSGDCREVKRLLLKKCREARKPDAVVRIACRELESFYLGDLKAVEKALNLTGLSRFQNKRKYRQPDNLHNPSRELAALTNESYQKVSGSRAIGKHLNIENNKSHSFHVLVSAIKSITA